MDPRFWVPPGGNSSFLRQAGEGGLEPDLERTFLLRFFDGDFLAYVPGAGELELVGLFRDGPTERNFGHPGSDIFAVHRDQGPGGAAVDLEDVILDLGLELGRRADLLPV